MKELKTYVQDHLLNIQKQINKLLENLNLYDNESIIKQEIIK